MAHIEFASQTATVTKFYYYVAPDRKAKAREALRRIAKCDALLHRDDGSADIVLENLWNILLDNH